MGQLLDVPFERLAAAAQVAAGEGVASDVDDALTALEQAGATLLDQLWQSWERQRPQTRGLLQDVAAGVAANATFASVIAAWRALLMKARSRQSSRGVERHTQEVEALRRIVQGRDD